MTAKEIIKKLGTIKLTWVGQRLGAVEPRRAQHVAKRFIRGMKGELNKCSPEEVILYVQLPRVLAVVHYIENILGEKM